MRYQKICQYMGTGILVLALFSCSSSEIGESRDVTQDKIYQQYNISYTEGEASATVWAQFRFAGDKGTTLVLNDPSSITLDGTTIKVDSNDVSGAFYRLYKPAKGFYGDHHLVFTDIARKQFSNPFSFDTFRLVNMPAVISRTQDYFIAFQAPALHHDDYIEISVAGDSAFNVTYTGTDTGTMIRVPAKELQRQKGKQLKLQASLYCRQALQENTTEGGAIEMQYTLKPIAVKLEN